MKGDRCATLVTNMEDVVTPERLYVAYRITSGGIIATLAIPGFMIVCLVAVLVFARPRGGNAVGFGIALGVLLVFELWLWDRLSARKGEVQYVFQGDAEVLSWGPQGTENSVRFAEVASMEVFNIEGPNSLQIKLHSGQQVLVNGVPFDDFRSVCRFARHHYKGPMKYLGTPVSLPQDL